MNYTAALLSRPKVVSLNLLKKLAKQFLLAKGVSVSALVTIVTAVEIVSQIIQARAPPSALPPRDLVKDSTTQHRASGLGLGGVLQFLLYLRQDFVLRKAGGQCKFLCK